MACPFVFLESNMTDTIASYNEFLRLTGDATAASNLVLAHALKNAQPAEAHDRDRPLTVPEVAGHLRVRPDKVLSWIRSGRLRGYNIAEKENGRPRYRVNADDLEKFIQQREVVQRAPQGRPKGSLPKKMAWPSL